MALRITPMSLKVEHVMTREVITVEFGSPLKDAVELMNTNEIGSIVVLKEGKPIGIVTERDLLKKIVVTSERVRQMKVDEIMSTPVIAAHPDEDVESAARTMLSKKIKKLPIIDDGRLVGVVTLTDLFRFEPELIRSYAILMRARTECNVLDPRKLQVSS
jgi:CBS domain-containing protein